jgi:hypothetical protein
MRLIVCQHVIWYSTFFTLAYIISNWLLSFLCFVYVYVHLMADLNPEAASTGICKWDFLTTAHWLTKLDSLQFTLVLMSKNNMWDDGYASI